MIQRIGVWERLCGDHRLVGEMICEIAENGRSRAAFRYEQEYLERSDAFALDPVSLPLTSDSFVTERPDMFGVFEDSLPDDWGRNLLVRKHQIPRHEQKLPTLLVALGSTGLGALSFTDHAKPQLPSPDISTLHLATLVEAAEKYECGEIRDSDISLLLSAGSSPGGARPKVLIKENKTHYLAKFPSIRDSFDIEFLLRRGVELPIKVRKESIELQRKLALLKDRDFKVKLGSILESDIRDYYAVNKFSYLEERLASMGSNS